MSENIFERRPKETPKAWEAFLVYRGLPLSERSRVAVAEKLGKHVRWIDKWADRWDWTERSRAYDNYLDRAGTDEQVDAIIEMKRRHIKAAQRVQEVALMALNSLADKAEAGLLEAKDETATAKLLDFATKLERLNRDEPGEVTENRLIAVPDYSRLTVEQLKVLREAKLTLDKGDD